MSEYVIEFMGQGTKPARQTAASVASKLTELLGVVFQKRQEDLLVEILYDLIPGIGVMESESLSNCVVNKV